MPESYISKNVRCPFYRKEKQNKISCEGVTKESSLNLIFPSIEKRKHYEERFCCADYKRCYIAHMLIDKWEKTK